MKRLTIQGILKKEIARKKAINDATRDFNDGFVSGMQHILDLMPWIKKRAKSGSTPSRVSFWGEPSRRGIKKAIAMGWEPVINEHGKFITTASGEILYTKKIS